MLRKGVLLLTSSIVLQTNNSYFVKHSLVEKTKLYLLLVTLMFQVKTNQRQFNAGKILIVEILICKSFVNKFPPLRSLYCLTKYMNIYPQ